MPGKDLWKLGGERAQEVNFTKSINHSKLAHRWGLGQGVRLKASAVTSAAKLIAKPILALIPVPALGSLAGMALEAAIDKAREDYRKRQTVEFQKLGQEHKVKIGIKNLDIGDWDRYRYKAGHSFNELKKALDTYLDSSRDTVSICNDAFRLSYKYHYFKKRTAKLRMEAVAMKQICDEIIDWVDGLENAVAQQKVEESVKTFCQGAEAKVMELHAECDSEFCVHKDYRKSVWAEEIREFRKLAATAINTFAEPLVDGAAGGDFNE
jgi:molecular chaperone GrpE (heat shock protein)